MIFTLIDLYNYKTREGRYAPQALGTYMSMGFENRIPKETLNLLESGDVLFTQRFNSLVSWAIMYFSSSEIDHSAIYIGDGRVLHMTLKGSKVHSIDALAEGTRILPIRFGVSEEEIPLQPPPDSEPKLYRPAFPISKLPPKLQFAWGGLRIIAGFHPDRYRWRHLIDLFFLCTFVDLAFLWILRFPVALSVCLIFLLLGLLNMIRFKVYKRLGKPIKYLSHPDIGYSSFSRVGGIMFSNIGPLVLVDFGVLPIGAFLALSGESPDDGTPDELKEFRESARNIAKRWGWISSIEQTEDEQSNKYDVKKDKKPTDSPRQIDE